ncbi:MAG: alkaline phosphatase family protein, partial [Catenulispora sp.]
MSGKSHHTPRQLDRRTIWRRAAATAAGAALTLTGLAAATAPARAAGGVPRYDHVVLVLEENHAYDEVVGSASAPYINNTLAAGGASFSQSFAIEHPSEPNYLDLFSGSNQGVTDDSCPHTFSTANEGAQLIAAGDTFSGYSEGLPSVGSTACTSGSYARKHVPWVNFTNVTRRVNKTFAQFPADYARLPA